MPRELTNVSGKSVLSWLLGSLKVRTDTPAALRVSAAALLSAAVRRALTDAERRPHLHRAPRRDRQVRGLPHGAPLVPGRPEAATPASAAAGGVAQAVEACRSRVDVSLVPLHVDTRGAVETVLALLQRMEDAVRTRRQRPPQRGLAEVWQS